MALFTFTPSTQGGNAALQYEELQSDETLTAVTALPTDSAAQFLPSSSRSALEGSGSQSFTNTAGLSSLESAPAASAGQAAEGLAARLGLGTQADAQSFATANSGLAAPDTTLGSGPTGGFGNLANSAYANSGNVSSNTQTTINNPPNPPGPVDPNPPVDTTTPPLIHIDVSLPENPVTAVTGPVTNLVTDTLANLAENGLGAVPDILADTTGTVGEVLDNLLSPTGLDIGVTDILNIALLNTAEEPTASVLDAALLQNLPPLEDTLANTTTALTNGDLGGVVTSLTDALFNGDSPLLELNLGSDSTESEGSLLDVAALDGLTDGLLGATLGTTDVNDANNLLADINLLPSDDTLASVEIPLLTENPLLELTAGADNNATEGALADVGLLEDGNLAAVQLPLLADNPLVELTAGADTTSAEGSLLDLGLGDTENGIDNLIGLNLLGTDVLPGENSLIDLSVNLPEAEDVAATLTGVTETLGDTTGTLTDVLTDLVTNTGNTATATLDSVADALNISNDTNLGPVTENLVPEATETLNTVTTTATTAVTNTITNLFSPLSHGFHW